MQIVTGAEGFLGRQVVACLARNGMPLIAVDRVDHVGSVVEGVTYHKADLSDATTLLPEIGTSDVPLVLIHLAWDMRRHDGYSVQAEQIRQFAALLDYWGGRGLCRVIAIGSAEEYGRRPGVISETDAPVMPLSPYGWAKRSARSLAELWSERNGVPVIWLRPFIMYGTGQRGDMMIPSAVDAVQKKRKTAFTDGRQRRDFVYVDDVAEAVNKSLKVDIAGFNEFNLGRGEGVPIADVLMAMASHYHAEDLFDLGARPRRPGEPESQVANTSRARDILGWQASIGWREGLARLFDGEPSHA